MTRYMIGFALLATAFGASMGWCELPSYEKLVLLIAVSCVAPTAAGES